MALCRDSQRKTEICRQRPQAILEQLHPAVLARDLRIESLKQMDGRHAEDVKVKRIFATTDDGHERRIDSRRHLDASQAESVDPLPQFGHEGVTREVLGI